MMYKEFNVEVAKALAAKIIISDEDMRAANFSNTYNVVERFKETNPQYKDCSYTRDLVENNWVISLWTTSEVVFKEK